jgi:prefoldin subunit 5
MTEKTIETRLDQIEKTLESINVELEKIQVRGEAYDAKLDAYQKASNQVVNLSFGLIITAVLAIIIPAVVK